MELTNGESKSRKRLIPSLLKLLNEKSVPQLEWVNKEERIWKMPWKHHKRTILGDPTAVMLLELAKHLHGYTDRGDPKIENLKRWKELLRNALRSLKKDVEELVAYHMLEGDNPYKVYKFLDNKPNVAKKKQKGNVCDFHRRNDEIAHSSHPEAVHVDDLFLWQQASSTENGVQFYTDSLNQTLLPSPFVPFYDTKQLSPDNNSAFQKYSHRSAIPTHILDDQEPAVLFPRLQFLPSPSCSTDNSVIASENFANNFLDMSHLSLCGQSIQGNTGGNNFRSRSPLSNDIEDKNLGNIPRIITDMEHGDIVLTSAVCSSTAASPSAINVRDPALLVAADTYRMSSQDTMRNNIRSVAPGVNYTQTLFQSPNGFSHKDGFVRNSTDNESLMQGEGKSMQGDGNFVHGVGTFVQGVGKFVQGDGNCVHGVGTFVQGDGNFVQGVGKFVQSEGKFMQGDGNFVHGVGTFVQGVGKFVQGDGNFVHGVGTFVQGDGNFVQGGGKFVQSGGDFVQKKETFAYHERNNAQQNRNISAVEGNLVSHEAACTGNTPVSNCLNARTDSASAFVPTDVPFFEIPFSRVESIMNSGNYLNVQKIMEVAPRSSLVVIASYFFHYPVKYEVMTGNFRICFLPDNETIENIRCCPDPDQFGPVDVEIFELPKIDKFSKQEKYARDTQKVLNNLIRGVIIECESQDIYATRYCKAVPHFCIPEVTQFQKMERQQKVKIFDFQSTLNSGVDPNFRYQNSKPCVRLAFAVKDANRKAAVLNIDIWHKDAYQKVQEAAEKSLSLEPDCSVSDEYDARLEILQCLIKSKLDLSTNELQF